MTVTQSPSAEPAAGDRVEGHAEGPWIEAASRDLPWALRAMAARAVDLLSFPGTGKTLGFIECLSCGQGGLVWILGWMESRLPLHAPVAIAADGVAYPSALVAASHGGRTDLPEGAFGIIGLLRTDWRSTGGGGGDARLVFLDGAAAGARLRVVEKPKFLTAGQYAGWVEKRGDVLGGPFAGALRRTLGAAAAEAARAPAGEGGAPESFKDLMGRGARLRADGHHEAALDLFRAALALEPRSAWARSAAAGTLGQLGRAEEAEEACRALLADEPGNTGALMMLGHSLRHRGDSAGALPLFQSALALEPRAAWARMAVADTLADLNRLDEAEEACRAVVADEPDNFGALMSLGHIANARADRRAGAGWFERAVRASPDAMAARLALADALRNLGDYDAAAEAAKAMLARDPDRAEGWMSLGHTERRAGRREAALDAFARAAERMRGSAGPLVEMAIEERGLGRPDASERLLNRALETDGGSVEALLQLGEHLRLANEPDRALAMFRQAMAAPRPAPWAYLAASQTLVDLGEFDAALRTLEDADARLGAKPEFAAKRAELLRRTGDWPDAWGVIEEAARTWPRHFGVWLERAHLERMRGGLDAHAACLDEAPAGTTHERSRVHILRGLLAAERWRFDEAMEHQERAVALNPADGWPRHCLAQARLLTLDFEDAREQLRAVARLGLSAAKLQGRSSNISQTHLGQLIDEFVLDGQALAELRAMRDLPPDERVEPLLALVRRCPEYTPAAIGLLIALRQSGRLAPRPRAVGSGAGTAPIPRTVAQYWNDASVPPDLGKVMGSWGKLYPGFALRRFSDEQAVAFLARFHAPGVRAAYLRSPEPAQKADIFRLAYLWSEGGYYADADDRLVGDFEDLHVPGARLLLYQEDFGTIGNNVIGAVPGHPVIGRALRLAVEAINRGDKDILWLSTGPGLLTRAFAASLADLGREPLAALGDTVVLEHGELQRTVSIHCLVGYKNTERHWSRTAFGRRATTAGAGLAAPPPAPAPQGASGHGAGAG